MKRIIFILTIIIATLTSCVDNVYINGDLDGMWQLQKVEEKDDTTVIYPQDIYYSFQRNLTFISRMNETNNPLRYLGNLYYNEEEKTVTINGLRNFPFESQVATLETLKKFMIFNTETVFDIQVLNNDQLIMDYENYRYTLRRW